MYYNKLCNQVRGNLKKGLKNKPMIKLIAVLAKIIIVTIIVLEITKDIKNRVDSDQTDNPDNKEQ